MCFERDGFGGEGLADLGYRLSVSAQNEALIEFGNPFDPIVTPLIPNCANSNPYLTVIRVIAH